MKRDEKEFEVFIKRIPGYELELSLRFQANNGHGVIGLGSRGGGDSEPASAGERAEVSAAVLRAGRFIHVLPGSGRRQSYALSRLEEDLLRNLPEERWVSLDALTEFGFRYLVLGAMPTAAEAVTGEVDAGFLAAAHAAQTPVTASGTASVSIAPPKARAATPPRRNLIPPSAPTPARPTPVEPSLAAAAMAGLSREDAIQHLGAETQKVATLLDRLATVERVLAESQQRESDLLGVLAAWQQRAQD